MRLLLTLGLLFLTAIVHGQNAELVVPAGHFKPITHLSVSQDGRYLISAGYDKKVKLWEVASGRLLRDFSSNDNFAIQDMAWSPKNSSLAVVEQDGKVIVHQISDRSQRQLTSGAINSATSVCFSRDGRYLFHGTAGAQVYKYDLQKPDTPAFSFEDRHRGKVVAIAVSENNKLIASGDNQGEARLWNAENGQLVTLFEGGHQQGITGIAISLNEKWVLTGSVDKTAKIWDRKGGNIHLELHGHKGEITSVAFAPNAVIAVTGSKDGTARLWDLNTGACIDTIKPFAGLPVAAAAFAPDGSSLFLASGGSQFFGKKGIIIQLDLNDTDRRLKTFEGVTDNKFSAVQFSPNGKYLMISTDPWEDFNKGSIRIWNLQRGELLEPFADSTKSVHQAIFHPTKNLVLSSRNNNIEFRKYPSGQVQRLIPDAQRASISVLAMERKGSIILSGSEKSVGPLAVIRKTDSDSSPITLDGHRNKIDAGVFSWDGSYVVTGSSESLMVWRTADGQLLHKLSDFPVGISNLSAHPQKNLVAAAAPNLGALIIDLENGTPIDTFAGYLSSVTFSPDGRLLAMGDSRGDVQLRALENGRIIERLTKHTGEVRYVDFSADGKFLVTAGDDNRVIVWDVKSGKELFSIIGLGDTDWVAVCPSGQFDASPAAMELLYFLVEEDGNLVPVALDQLKNRYYEHGLIAKLLTDNLDDLTPGTIGYTNEILLAPKVEATINGDKLRVKLEERAGRMGRLSIFLNGKEIIPDANPERNQRVTVDLALYNKDLWAHPDSTNRVRIIAYDYENWLKSQPVELLYDRYRALSKGDGTSQTPVDPEVLVPPKLYILAIGTSNYQDENITDLQYPDHDAAAMVRAFYSVGKPLFPADSLEAICFATQEAAAIGLPAYITYKPTNRDNIQKAFQRIARQAKTEDVLLVFLSGHGITRGNGEDARFYYLLPQYQEANSSNPATRNQQTLSTDTLTTWLNAISANKKVVIIDACNSGGAVERLLANAKSLNSSQFRTFETMKDRTGIYILSGSAADKDSFESGAFNQGLLTYALLSGMRGDALEKNPSVSDSLEVKVMELFEHAKRTVPDLARQIQKVQTPMMRGGSSFPIGWFTPEADIPLSDQVPVIYEVRMQNMDGLDPEKLESQLDNLMRQIKGSFKYTPGSTTYPGGYRVRGIYETDDAGVINILRLNLIRENTIIHRMEGISGDTNAKQMSKQIIQELQLNLMHGDDS